MFIIPQLEAHCSHVLSQWTYRWLALPLWKAADQPRIALESLEVSDWTDYIHSRLDGESAPWTILMRSMQAAPVALATLIAENIRLTLRGGADFIDFYHPLYPPLLACIKDPPNCLTIIGPADTLSKPAISMVGSRRASGFALRETEELAAALAAEGAVIASGGALGCDITAHRGALRSGERPSPTIVVLAGGLARFYPRCNESVFRLLQHTGAVFISERLWEYPARPYDFPVRNRIIAGLSPRLLLMQAGERSGAKVTAQLALEQNREVFVMVHPEDDVRALGSKELLLEGATPFFSAQDYLRMAWSCDGRRWFEAGAGFESL